MDQGGDGNPPWRVHHAEFGMWCHGQVNKVVFGLRLDSMIPEIFSNLNDLLILWRWSGLKSLEKGLITGQYLHKGSKSICWGGVDSAEAQVGRILLALRALLEPWAEEILFCPYWRCCSLSLVWEVSESLIWELSGPQEKSLNLFEGKYFVEEGPGLN